MYVKPSVLPEDKLSDCLTRLGRDSAFSCSWWHLFLPRGMYSRGSGPRLGRRLAAEATLWAVEKPGKAEIKHLLDSLHSDQPRSGCCWKGHAEPDPRTCFHFWRCRDGGSSDKCPGILLWCKLLKRSRWEFFHLALTFIPRSEQRENKKNKQRLVQEIRQGTSSWRDILQDLCTKSEIWCQQNSTHCAHLSPGITVSVWIRKQKCQNKHTSPCVLRRHRSNGWDILMISGCKHTNHEV